MRGKERQSIRIHQQEAKAASTAHAKQCSMYSKAGSTVYTSASIPKKGRLEGDWANGGGILGHGTLSLENGGKVVHAALVEGSKVWGEC